MMKKIFSVLFLAVLLLTSCSAPETKREPPQPVNEQMRREYAEAVREARIKKPNSMRRLQIFIQRYPKSELTDDALYLLGQIYYEQGDYLKAQRVWSEILQMNIQTEYEDEARVGSAQALAQLGKFDEALATLSKFKIKSTTSKRTAVQGLQLSSRLKLQKNDQLGALSDLTEALSYASPQEAAALSARASDVAATMSQAQLERIVSKPEYRSVELPARYRLANIYFGQKNWGDARIQYQLIVDKFPRTEQALRAADALSSIEAQQRVDPQTIGVILPLTGKHAMMGYKTLRGIQMAFGIYTTGGASGSPPVKLAIIDSEANPDIARRGVDRLVSEDHVVAIIGGILTKTSRAIAVRGQELGLPIFVLSQKSDITEIGPFVFRNALTAELQMRALVDMAIRERGWKRFALLYPNDAYGTEYATVFWDVVNTLGGEVVAAQTYQPEETDFRNTIRKLVSTFYPEDRIAELKLRQAELEKSRPKKSARGKNTAADLLPPIVDFDALFIADSPKAVGQIAPMLAYNDVEHLPLLGTNIWNTPQLVERGAKYVEGALFVDSYFTDEPRPSLKKFIENFQNIYGYTPDVFEAQGYDTATIVQQALKRGNYNSSRQSFQHELEAISNVDGSTGPLSVSPHREVEKSLMTLTVHNGKIVKWTK